MLKNPISKTGNIRYLEILKIFVLISFLYAFISDFKSFELLNNVLIYIGYLLVLILLIIVIYVNIIELNDLVKTKLWFLLQIYKVKIKSMFTEKTTIFRSLFFTDKKNINLKLCIIRC